MRIKVRERDSVSPYRDDRVPDGTSDGTSGIVSRQPDHCRRALGGGLVRGFGELCRADLIRRGHAGHQAPDRCQFARLQQSCRLRLPIAQSNGGNLARRQ